jgi:lipopolysaccharide transport system ATP-binding protein
MRPIITIRNLSKRYTLGQREVGYQTLREALVKAGSGAIGRVRSRFNRRHLQNPPGKESDLWALRDVTFDVQPGEVLGIIGRNGAGKSTLLKILSRITEPSSGQVELYGRVGSLLEVGTGFHPELTGRENIFLNGAILGMRRKEIARKLDEIVAFAEVDRFIDTPVKRYSNGMFVRLAFAVAAHLEPEILLVDEVLAVGDQAFQKRCLGKMGDVAREGRTVVFVSHNMASIEALCNTCLFLSDGEFVTKGQTHQVVSRYMTADLRPESASVSLSVHSGRRRGSRPLMKVATVRDDTGAPTGAIRMGSSLSVAVSFACDAGGIVPGLGVVLKNAHGVAIFTVHEGLVGGNLVDHRVECGTLICELDNLPLLPGRYSFDLYLGDTSGAHSSDVVSDAISFEVQPADVFGTGQLPAPQGSLIYWPARFAFTNGAIQGHEEAHGLNRG